MKDERDHCRMKEQELCCDDCRKEIPYNTDYREICVDDPIKRERVLKRFPKSPKTVVLCVECFEMAYHIRSTSYLH